MECEKFFLPDWSPPDDPARPCRPSENDDDDWCSQVERGSEEEERINDLITSTGGNMEKSESQTVDNSENQAEVCKAASHEKLSAKQKLKIASSSQKRKETDDSDIVIKTEEEKNKEEEEDQDSDMDQVRDELPKVKIGRKRKKEARKTRKMAKRQPEMKDLMVGRRMASLNASAMMQVQWFMFFDCFQGQPPPRHQLDGYARNVFMTDHAP